MPSFRLRLSAPAAVTADEARTSFYWLTDGRSSFKTDLGPNLSSLGPVPALNVDLVRIAVSVYAADRSVARKARGSNWNRRSFQLEIPVSDAAAWDTVAPNLEASIGFLSGDSWKLRFNEDKAPAETVAMKTATPKRVVLLSGGSDSAIGALVSRADLEADEEHVLLSHFSANTLAPIQHRVASQIESLLPGPRQQHLQIHFARNQRRIDNTKYANEYSTRSRSLLFLALGLAVASMDNIPLWIPENGFASMNPPLGPERRGSLSTRTTHPGFLEGLSDVLSTIGAHSLIENPFLWSTKGEMFMLAAELVGGTAAATLLSTTNSCAHTGQRTFGISPSTQCGVCFGCVVRHASFNAAGLADATSYVCASGNSRLQAWLDSISVEPAVRNFVARGVRQRDVIAMSLPSTYRIAEVLTLCQRGAEELSGLVS